MAGPTTGTRHENQPGKADRTMRLTERIWLVGSGLQGSGLTNDFDCHVYLVDCGSSAVLIDSGAGIEPDRITAEIGAAGFTLDRISHLLLTHGHADHSGGVAYFRQRTGCAVVASVEVAGFMERGDTTAISLDLAKEAGIYPADYQWRTCPVAVTLADGQAIQVGDSVFTALATPGHAAGHLSFTTTGEYGPVLFAGDAVFHGGQILLQAIEDCSIWQYRQTIRKLADLEIATLLPGHKTLVMRNGQAHIALAEQAFRTLMPPRNLL
jgi:glyoxylase-like metal-dependent hydrolase (beta-lactamase superfamily II)